MDIAIMDCTIIFVYFLTNICISLAGMTPKTVIIASETSRWIHQQARTDASSDVIMSSSVLSQTNTRPVHSIVATPVISLVPSTSTIKPSASSDFHEKIYSSVISDTVLSRSLIYHTEASNVLSTEVFKIEMLQDTDKSTNHVQPYSNINQISEQSVDGKHLSKDISPSKSSSFGGHQNTGEIRRREEVESRLSFKDFFSISYDPPHTEKPLTGQQVLASTAIRIASEKEGVSTVNYQSSSPLSSIPSLEILRSSNFSPSEIAEWFDKINKRLKNDQDKSSAAEMDSQESRNMKKSVSQTLSSAQRRTGGFVESDTYSSSQSYISPSSSLPDPRFMTSSPPSETTSADNIVPARSVADSSTIVQTVTMRNRMGNSKGIHHFGSNDSSSAISEDRLSSADVLNIVTHIVQEEVQSSIPTDTPHSQITSRTLTTRTSGLYDIASAGTSSQTVEPSKADSSTRYSSRTSSFSSGVNNNGQSEPLSSSDSESVYEQSIVNIVPVATQTERVYMLSQKTEKISTTPLPSIEAYFKLPSISINIKRRRLHTSYKTDSFRSVGQKETEQKQTNNNNKYAIPLSTTQEPKDKETTKLVQDNSYRQEKHHKRTSGTGTQEDQIVVMSLIPRFVMPHDHPLPRTPSPVRSIATTSPFSPNGVFSQSYLPTLNSHRHTSVLPAFKMDTTRPITVNARQSISQQTDGDIIQGMKFLPYAQRQFQTQLHQSDIPADQMSTGTLSESSSLKRSVYSDVAPSSTAEGNFERSTGVFSPQQITRTSFHGTSEITDTHSTYDDNWKITSQRTTDNKGVQSGRLAPDEYLLSSSISSNIHVKPSTSFSFLVEKSKTASIQDQSNFLTSSRPSVDLTTPPSYTLSSLNVDSSVTVDWIPNEEYKILGNSNPGWPPWLSIGGRKGEGTPETTHRKEVSSFPGEPTSRNSLHKTDQNQVTGYTKRYNTAALRTVDHAQNTLPSTPPNTSRSPASQGLPVSGKSDTEALFSRGSVSPPELGVSESTAAQDTSSALPGTKGIKDYLILWIFDPKDEDVNSLEFVARVGKGLQLAYEIGFRRQSHVRVERSAESSNRINIQIRTTRVLPGGNVEVQFTVSDNGLMISAADATRMFDRVTLGELNRYTGVESIQISSAEDELIKIPLSGSEWLGSAEVAVQGQGQTDGPASESINGQNRTSAVSPFSNSDSSEEAQGTTPKPIRTSTVKINFEETLSVLYESSSGEFNRRPVLSTASVTSTTTRANTAQMSPATGIKSVLSGEDMYNELLSSKSRTRSSSDSYTASNSYHHAKEPLLLDSKSVTTENRGVSLEPSSMFSSLGGGKSTQILSSDASSRETILRASISNTAVKSLSEDDSFTRHYLILQSSPTLSINVPDTISTAPKSYEAFRDYEGSSQMNAASVGLTPTVSNMYSASSRGPSEKPRISEFESEPLWKSFGNPISPEYANWFNTEQFSEDSQHTLGVLESPGMSTDATTGSGSQGETTPPWLFAKSTRVDTKGSFSSHIENDDSPILIESPSFVINELLSDLESALESVNRTLLQNLTELSASESKMANKEAMLQSLVKGNSMRPSVSNLTGANTMSGQTESQHSQGSQNLSTQSFNVNTTLSSRDANYHSQSPDDQLESQTNSETAAKQISFTVHYSSTTQTPKLTKSVSDGHDLPNWTSLPLSSRREVITETSEVSFNFRTTVSVVKSVGSLDNNLPTYNEDHRTSVSSITASDYTSIKPSQITASIQTTDLDNNFIQQFSITGDDTTHRDLVTQLEETSNLTSETAFTSEPSVLSTNNVNSASPEQSTVSYQVNVVTSDSYSSPDVTSALITTVMSSSRGTRTFGSSFISSSSSMRRETSQLPVVVSDSTLTVAPYSSSLSSTYSVSAERNSALTRSSSIKAESSKDLPTTSLLMMESSSLEETAATTTPTTTFTTLSTSTAESSESGILSLSSVEASSSGTSSPVTTSSEIISSATIPYSKTAPSDTASESSSVIVSSDTTTSFATTPSSRTTEEISSAATTFSGTLSAMSSTTMTASTKTPFSTNTTLKFSSTSSQFTSSASSRRSPVSSNPTHSEKASVTNTTSSVLLTANPQPTPSSTTSIPPMATTTSSSVPDNSLMVINLRVDLGINISSTQFREHLEEGLTALYVTALKRTKRHTNNNPRHKREARVVSQVVSSDRDPDESERMTSVFVVKDGDDFVAADEAVSVYNRMTASEMTDVLNYEVSGPVTAAQRLAKSLPDTAENRTNYLLIFLIVVPAVLLILGILGLVARMRVRRRANAVGDLPSRYQRGETLDDHNLTVDVEKGEIVDKTPQSTPSLVPKSSSSAERKVPLTGGVSALTGIEDFHGFRRKDSYVDFHEQDDGKADNSPGKNSHRSLILKEKELLEKLGVQEVIRKEMDSSDDQTLELPKRIRPKRARGGTGASKYSTVGSECPLLSSSGSMTTVSSVDTDVHTDASDEFTVIIPKNSSPQIHSKRQRVTAAARPRRMACKRQKNGGQSETFASIGIQTSVPEDDDVLASKGVQTPGESSVALSRSVDTQTQKQSSESEGSGTDEKRPTTRLGPNEKVLPEMECKIVHTPQVHRRQGDSHDIFIDDDDDDLTTSDVPRLNSSSDEPSKFNFPGTHKRQVEANRHQAQQLMSEVAQQRQFLAARALDDEDVHDTPTISSIGSFNDHTISSGQISLDADSIDDVVHESHMESNEVSANWRQNSGGQETFYLEPEDEERLQMNPSEKAQQPHGQNVSFSVTSQRSAGPKIPVRATSPERSDEVKEDFEADEMSAQDCEDVGRTHDTNRAQKLLDTSHPLSVFVSSSGEPLCLSNAEVMHRVRKELRKSGVAVPGSGQVSRTNEDYSSPTVSDSDRADSSGSSDAVDSTAALLARVRGELYRIDS